MNPCEKIKTVIDKSIGCSVSFTKSEWVHIRECKACWKYYNRSIELERLFASGGKSSLYPSEFELARIGKFISSYEPFNNLNFVSKNREWVQKIWNQTFCCRLAFGIATALIIGTALIVHFANSDKTNHVVAESMERKSVVHSEAFAHLGSIKALQNSSEPTVSARDIAEKTFFAVRAVCQTQNGEIWSLSEKPGPQEVAACPINGEIDFAYTANRAGYLYVFVIDPAKNLKWLVPQADKSEQYFIAKADELTPLKFFLNCSKSYSAFSLGGKYEVTFIKTETKWPLNKVFQFAKSFRNFSENILFGVQVNHLSVYFNPITEDHP